MLARRGAAHVPQGRAQGVDGLGSPLADAGVECRKDHAMLDEIPGACKDIDTVLQNQRDLVDVVHSLKQVLCVRGS